MVDAARTGQPLLTAAQVGALVGLKETTVRKLTNRGDIVATRVTYKSLRYAPADVDAWLESRRVRKGGAPGQEQVIAAALRPPGKSTGVKILTPRGERA